MLQNPSGARPRLDNIEEVLSTREALGFMSEATIANFKRQHAAIEAEQEQRQQEAVARLQARFPEGYRVAPPKELPPLPKGTQPFADSGEELEAFRNPLYRANGPRGEAYRQHVYNRLRATEEAAK